MRTHGGVAVLSLLIACGDNLQVEPVIDVPDAPSTGIQMLFKQFTIHPGEDIEFCSYFNLETAETLAALGAQAFDQDHQPLDNPFLLQHLVVNDVDLDADELAINKIEIVASPGLHHVQLMALEKDTVDYDRSHVFECGSDLFGGPLTGDVEPLFFTPLPNYSASYEPGIARILKRTVDHEVADRTRGPQLLYNFHYINVSDEPIEAQVAVNFHTVPRETVEHPIRSAWWNYFYFEAQANGATSTNQDAHGSFKVPVALVGITSHQHELGTLFTYSRGGQEIYRSDYWAEPPYLQFPPDTMLAAGEDLAFQCQWNNHTSDDRFFGLRADDEMCTAIIEYYPLDEAAAAALLEQLRIEAEMQGNQGGPFGAAVTLETFFPMPDALVAQIQSSPSSVVDILDGDIMCGVAKNFKELEAQYGRAPDQLAELQFLVDILSGFCNL